MTPVFARLCAVLRRFSLGKKSFTVAALGYIGPADTALSRNFPLGLGRLLPQAIAQGNNFSLPGGEAGLYTLPHLSAGIPGIQLLQHIVIHRYNIHKGQGTAIPSRLQGLSQRHLALQFLLGPEMHQNFIFNASAGVSSQPDIFVRFERRNSLNQTDGPNRD